MPDFSCQPFEAASVALFRSKEETKIKKPSHKKEFARYSAQAVLGMLGLSCYILADTFFISKGLGVNGLAALNLSIPVYSFIHGIGLMLGMGAATRYSILKSQKDYNLSNLIFTNTVSLAVVFSALFVLAGIFFSEGLTRVLGANAEVFEMTNIYLKVILLFAPAFIMNDVMICFVRNDGNPRLAMLAMLGGSLLNIILDYLFIFVFQMGMFGAVLATGLAPIFSMLILLEHRVKRKNGFHLVKTRPSSRMALDTFTLGFPSLITEVSSGIVMVIFNMIILNLLGNTGVAAYGVIANLSLVVLCIYTGIAQGIQPLISKAYGRYEMKTVRQLLRYALITMSVASCIIYLTLFFFADPVAGVFNSENNMQLQRIAVAGIKIYFSGILFAGFNIIVSMLFTSTVWAMPAQIISLSRGLIVIVPMAFLLSVAAGITGVWLAFPVTEGLVAALGVVFFIRWRKTLPAS